MGSSLGAAGARLGACFALVYSVKPSALPQEVRRLPLGSGLTVTCTVPLRILNAPPHPDLARDSQAAVRAWRLWGLLCERQALPSLIPACPQGEVVSPRHTAEMWVLGGPGCRGNGSACPEAARLRVAWACLPPCRPCHHPPALSGDALSPPFGLRDKSPPEPAPSLCQS